MRGGKDKTKIQCKVVENALQMLCLVSESFRFAGEFWRLFTHSGINIFVVWKSSVP